MSGLDLGSLLQNLAGGQKGDLAGGLQELLAKAGGLGGLLSQLQASGLDDKVQSWIGTGMNEQVTPGEIEQALGGDTVSSVAQRAGVSKDEAASGLASVLPQLVDELSPDGKLPDLGPIDDIVEKFLR
jgi:uncharacterized protein YidB (DUF937 family)